MGYPSFPTENLKKNINNNHTSLLINYLLIKINNDFRQVLNDLKKKKEKGSIDTNKPIHALTELDNFVV